MGCHRQHRRFGKVCRHLAAQAFQEADDVGHVFFRELFAELQLRHDAHGLRQAGHRAIVKIRRRDRHVAQLRHLEDESIGLVFGVVETAFVIAFETFRMIFTRKT